MIEGYIVSYLSEKFPGVHVSTDRPAQEPEKYIIVNRGSLQRFSDYRIASITIWSHAPSDYESALLDDQVGTEMLNMTQRDIIANVNIENSFDDKDQATKNSRYRSEFDVTFFVT